MPGSNPRLSWTIRMQTFPSAKTLTGGSPKIVNAEFSLDVTAG
jgi:hypothetical protein